MPVSGAPSLFSETYKPLVGGIACWPAHPIALKFSRSAARSSRRSSECGALFSPSPPSPWNLLYGAVPPGSYCIHKPHRRTGGEHDDRDQRHLRDCVHGLVSLSRTKSKEEAPHGGSGASRVPLGGTW